MTYFFHKPRKLIKTTLRYIVIKLDTYHSNRNWQLWVISTTWPEWLLCCMQHLVKLFNLSIWRLLHIIWSILILLSIHIAIINISKIQTNCIKNHGFISIGLLIIIQLTTTRSTKHSSTWTNKLYLINTIIHSWFIFSMFCLIPVVRFEIFFIKYTFTSSTVKYFVFLHLK